MAKELTNKQVTNGDNSLSGKKIVVRGIDMSVEQILEYDRKGATLIFDTTGSTFPQLSEDVLQRMSKWNVDRYRVSKEIWEELSKKDPLREVLDGIEFGANRGSATARLNIENRNKDFVYWWEAPENVYDKVSRGWEVVQGSGERTIHSDGSRIHRIGKKGEEELILLRMPRKMWMKHQAEEVERYKRGTKGLGSATAATVGANPKDFIEDEKLEKLVASGKVQFRPVESEGPQQQTD